MITMRALILVMLFLTVSDLAQEKQDGSKGEADVSYQVVRSKDRPDLAVNISSLAKLKIAVRKQSYGLGEMLVVDAAVLTNDVNSVFMPSIKRVEIFTDNKILYYVIKDSTSSFDTMKSNSLETSSFSFLLGCEEKPFSIQNELVDGLSAAAFFERDLFVSWGDGCIKVGNGTKLKVHAELENDSVVVSTALPSVKSAVGKLTSPAVNIVIDK